LLDSVQRVASDLQRTADTEQAANYTLSRLSWLKIMRCSCSQITSPNSQSSTPTMGAVLLVSGSSQSSQLSFRMASSLCSVAAAVRRRRFVVSVRRLGCRRYIALRCVVVSELVVALCRHQRHTLLDDETTKTAQRHEHTTTLLAISTGTLHHNDAAKTAQLPATTAATQKRTSEHDEHHEHDSVPSLFRRSSFFVLCSWFFVLRSWFFVLGSWFFVLRSSFFVLR